MAKTCSEQERGTAGDGQGLGATPEVVVEGEGDGRAAEARPVERRSSVQARTAQARPLCRLLLVEDSQFDTLLIQKHLKRIDEWQFDIRVVGDLASALHELGKEEFDLIVTDLMLPDGGGTELVEKIVAAQPDCAVVVLSGVDDTELEAQTVFLGAQDFLSKSELNTSLLRRTLRHAMIRNDADQSLLAIARRDALTGVANRVAFEEYMAQRLKTARPDETHFAVMVVDLDGFKAINDAYGHASGDTILQSCCTQLRSQLRAEDLLARLGGDEFAIVLDYDGQAATIGEVAQRVVDSVHLEIDGAKGKFVATISLGVATFPEAGAGPQDLLAAADAAMYRAKRAGKNRYAVWCADDRKAVATHACSDCSNCGQLYPEFELWFRPRLDLARGEILTVDTQRRWLTPEAREAANMDTRELHSLGERLLRRACEALLQWQSSGSKGPNIAISVPSALLREDLFCRRILAIVTHNGLEPGRLELSFGGALDFDSNPQALANLNQLGQQGFRLALEGFGSSQTDLWLVCQTKLSSVKIDRRTVAMLAGGGGAASAVVGCAVELGRRLNLEVVATGVDAPELLERVASLGCQSAQGDVVAPLSAGWFSRGYSSFGRAFRPEYEPSQLRYFQG